MSLREKKNEKEMILSVRTFTVSSEVQSEAKHRGDLRWWFGTRFLHLAVSFPLGFSRLRRLRAHRGSTQISDGGENKSSAVAVSWYV